MSKARDLASGAPAPAGVTSTELGYVDGVTSAIQTQLNQKPVSPAGVNKILNSDFSIWQRGTSFTGALNGSYTSDRWATAVSTSVSGLAWTVSQQTFTPGTAPVSGYEGTYFSRANISTIGSATAPRILTKVEDVRTFANQTVTISYWAKITSGTSAAENLIVVQNFGSGGSTPVTAKTVTKSYTTDWQRFTETFTMPSISGKTIGTSSFVEIRFVLEAANGANLDIWGVQLEAGSTASPFQTATGTIQGELAACQRYYYRVTPDVTSLRLGVGLVDTTTTAIIVVPFPVTMRTRVTALEQSGTAGDYSVNTSGATITVCSAVPTFQTGQTNQASTVLTVASGLTAGQGAFFRNTNTSGYLAWSAEL